MDFEARLSKVIEEGKAVLATYKPNPPGMIGFDTLNQGRFRAWRVQAEGVLTAMGAPCEVYVRGFLKSTSGGASPSYGQAGVGILETVLEEHRSGHLDTAPTSPSALAIVTNLCDRFHVITRQLRQRHDERPTLDITDEYDVQDLMHALMHLHFQDIRPEEWTPSNAGAGSRVDFLLKAERTVVEVKKTRRGLNAKKLGEELIIDIHRYQTHQDCGTLICFVYDPDGLISNPRGVEVDLNRDTPLTVRVLIRPA